HVTPEQHRDFARHFGDIQIGVFQKSHPTVPEIFEIAKEVEQTRNIGGAWHADGTWRRDPPSASILVAREPPPAGGHTMVYNMNMAYETLSEGMKKTLLGLRSVHSNLHVIRADTRERVATQPNYNEKADYHESTHPMVTLHRSGKKILYINAMYTTHIEG